MSSESEHEATAPRTSKIGSLAWVLVPTVLIALGLLALFQMTL